MKNLIKIKIKTYSFIDFLGYLKSKEMKIYNYQQIGEYEHSFETTYHNYLKIRKVYKDCRVEKSNTLKYLLIKLFSEKIVVFCLIISSFLYIFLSKLIFEVQVDGNSNYLSSYLIDELKEHNIDKFYICPKVNELKIIEKEIYNSNLDKFELLSITKKGSYILVNYEKKKKNLVLDEVKTKIYSSKDAIISKILVSTGKVLVKENNFVKKGDLIVDDHLLINEEEYFIGTKGLIYGYTYNKVQLYYQNIEEAFNEARYLVSSKYILEEKILEEQIIFHDESSKFIIFHYKCEEILNSY